MSALSADGSLHREKHEEDLMRLRDTIHSVSAETRYYTAQAQPE
ncbi:hypothetical protein ACGFYE_15580 [Streptomyces zaomyceticus]